MPRSDGFILPLMLILIMLLSLLILSLYEAENTHISLAASVQSLQNSESLAYAQVKAFNQSSIETHPNPSTAPEEQVPYLRDIDLQTHTRIWQIKQDGITFVIQCSNTDQCNTIKIHS